MEREKMLEEIAEYEKDLLVALNTVDKIRENTLPAFKKTRKMTYSVLSDKTVSSWLNDLRAAITDKRNPLLEKYALIENKIPTIKSNILIKKIVDQEVAWMNELGIKFPKVIKREQASVELFEKYALCELQTWSDQSIALYWQDIEEAVQKKRNFAQDRYDWLYKDLGRGSLEEFEDSLK